MKTLEHQTRHVCTPDSYLVLRIDGRAFHTFTRNMRKPEDPDLAAAMGKTTAQLAEQVPGAVVGYVQSDEASLLLAPFDANGGLRDHWFGGVQAKMTSVPASMFTALFMRNLNQDLLNNAPSLPTFDSRVVQFPGTLEGRRLVLEYFRWRQWDCTKNAVNAAAHNLFNDDDLRGKSTAERLQLLEDTPDSGVEHVLNVSQHGQVVHKAPCRKTSEYVDGRDGQTKTATVTRHRWSAERAPSVNRFTGPGGFLDQLVPHPTPGEA